MERTSWFIGRGPGGGQGCPMIKQRLRFQNTIIFNLSWKTKTGGGGLKWFSANSPQWRLSLSIRSSEYYKRNIYKINVSPIEEKTEGVSVDGEAIVTVPTCRSYRYDNARRRNLWLFISLYNADSTLINLILTSRFSYSNPSDAEERKMWKIEGGITRKW